MDEESERIRPPSWFMAVAASICASLGEMTISETGRGLEVRGMERVNGGGIAAEAVPRRRKRLALPRGMVSFCKTESRRRWEGFGASCSSETVESPVEVEMDERRYERGRKRPENKGGKGSAEGSWAGVLVEAEAAVLVVVGLEAAGVDRSCCCCCCCCCCR